MKIHNERAKQAAAVGTEESQQPHCDEFPATVRASFSISIRSAPANQGAAAAQSAPIAQRAAQRSVGSLTPASLYEEHNAGVTHKGTKVTLFYIFPCRYMTLWIQRAENSAGATSKADKVAPCPQEN